MPSAQVHYNETQTHQDVDECRSYDPYLIAYHKESNSFTFKDPWIQVVQEIHKSSNDVEVNLTVENDVSSNVVSTDHASLESTVDAQRKVEVETTDTRNESTTENVTHYDVVPPVAFVAIETLSEVSFPHSDFKAS